MKKYTIALIFLLFFTSTEVRSQNFSFSVNDTVSRYLADWEVHNQIILKYIDTTDRDVIMRSGIINANGDTVFVMSDYYILYEGLMPDSIFVQLDSTYSDRDSFYTKDTTMAIYQLREYDTLYPSEFLEEERLLIDTNFISMRESRTLDAGEYKIYVEVFDTNYVRIDTATCSFKVSSLKAPVIYKPFDHRKIHSNYIDTMSFTFNKLDQTDLYYMVSVVPIDTSDWLQPLEISFTDGRNPIFEFPITNGESSFNLSNHSQLLQNDQWVAWTIRAYIDSLYTIPVADNNGFAEPFTFSKTNDPAFIDIRRTTTHPWQCEASDIAGFESGNTDGWTTWTGKRLQGLRGARTSWRKKDNIKMQNIRFLSPRHEILNATDPAYLNGKLKRVPTSGGDHSFKIGTFAEEPVKVAQQATYRFTPTSETAFITLRYTYMLNDSDHKKDNQNAIFRIRISHKSIADKHNYYSTPIREFGAPEVYKLKEDGFLYIPWRCLNLDLSELIDKTVTLEVSSAHCVFGGHQGIGIIDFCGNVAPEINYSLNSTYCKDDDVSINLSNSKYLENWQYTVQKCTPSGDGFGTEYISSWYRGGETFEEYKLKGLLEVNNAKFECNTHYRIKVGGTNQCSGWEEEVKIIYISCPAIDAAGPNRCCPSGNCNLVIGSSPVPGRTYTWTSTQAGATNCLSSTSVANPVFNGPCAGVTFPITYIVEVDDGVCSSTDEMVIYANTPTMYGYVTQASAGCNRVYTAKYTGGESLEWIISGSNQNTVTLTGNNVIINPNNTTQTVVIKVTNTCGSSTYTFTIAPTNTVNQLFYGSFPKMVFTGVLVPQRDASFGPPIYPTWYEVDKDIGAPNSYNANGYRLVYIDRWGGTTVLRDVRNTTLKNGDIFWDGKDINGNAMYSVPPRSGNGTLISGNTYTLVLTLYNCTWPNDRFDSYTYRVNKCDGWIKGPKVFWKRIFGIPFHKREWICKNWSNYDEEMHKISIYYE